MGTIHRPSFAHLPLQRGPCHVVGLIALAYIALTLARYGGDPMKFALIGTRYDPGLAGGTWGYDGQFAYQIARDPLWAHAFSRCSGVSLPAHPLPARRVGAGAGARAIVSLDAHRGQLAGAHSRHVVDRGHLDRARGEPMVRVELWAFGGLLMAVRLDLTEPLAYALAQAAVLA